MKIYGFFANYGANGGRTGLAESMFFDTLKTAEREIKRLARAEHFQQTGNVTKCWVSDVNTLRRVSEFQLVGTSKQFQRVECEY